jgi:hypothetical protein
VRRGISHLTLMLLVTAAVVLLGAAQKAPCANERWVVHREGQPFPCYSDVSDLYLAEQLGGGRVPYLDACRPAERPCDEYPVLSMEVMWAAAAIAGGAPDAFAGFFWANIAILLICALLTTWSLEKLRARTVLFAAAPVLLIYGSINWDLIPVAAVALATLMFLRKRDLPAGVLLGIGAAAKVYPALLVIPFALERDRTSRRDAVKLIAAAALTWLALNVPFAIAAYPGWSEFFRSNGARFSDYESLWRILCSFGPCFGPRTVNLLSAVLTIAGTWWVWRRTVRRHPDLPRWAMSFPLLVVLLCASKVWSPQYGLWLLPFLALSGVPFFPYLQYQLAEVLLYMVRDLFFTDPPGTGVVSYRMLSVVVVVRALLLLRLLVLWMRSPLPPGWTGPEPARASPAPVPTTGRILEA